MIKEDELFKHIFESRNKELYIFLYLENNIYNDTTNFNIFDIFSTIEEYKDMVVFLSLKNPSEKLIKLLKIKDTPASIVFYHNKISDEGFKNNNNYSINMLSMRKQLEKFISIKNLGNDISDVSTSINVLDDPYYILKDCIHRDRCLLAFLNGEYDDTNYVNSEYFNNINLLNYKSDSLINQDSYTVFAVNATCHTYLMNDFKIQFNNLPTLVYYSGNKNIFYNINELKYLKIINNTDSNLFTNEYIDYFVDKIKKNELIGASLNKKSINAKRIDCSSIKKRKDLNYKFDYGGLDFEEYDKEDEDEDEDENNYDYNNINKTDL